MKELQLAVKKQSFWEDQPEDLLPEGNLYRDDYLEKLAELEGANLVVCLFGQRRCGKSVVARQYVTKLRLQGIPSQNILYLNFFLRPLASLKQEGLFAALVDWWYRERVDNSRSRYLILDEVHLLENWDTNLASLFEDPTFKAKIIITGSNSRLLSTDLTTMLGGRYFTLNIFPFSFAEFCQFQGRPYQLESVESYLRQGGLPEGLKIKGEENRAILINDIIGSIVANDIVLRYNPSNPELLYRLIEYCRISFSSELSVKSIHDHILAVGKLGQKTTTLIEEYLGFMEDVFFLYYPRTYSYRAKDILKRKVDKIYLSDLAFAHDSVSPKGRLLENMIFLELRRQGYKVERFLAYRNKNIEIDFWIRKLEFEALVQVCWALGDPEENSGLWEREFGNLTYVNKNIPKWVVSIDRSVKSPYQGISHYNVIEFLNLISRVASSRSQG